MAAVNVGLEIFSGMLVLILMVSLLTNGDRKSPSTRLFFAMLGIDLFGLLASGVAREAGGDARRLLCQGGTLAQYLLGYLLLLLYGLYLLEYLETKPPGVTGKAVRCLCAGGGVLTLLSQKFGLFYRISPEGQYSRGPFFWLAICLGIGVLILVGIGMLHRPVDRTWRRSGICLGYELLPLAALVGQWHSRQLTVLYLWATLALLFLFVNVQLGMEKQRKETEQELAEKRMAVMLSQIQPHFLYNTLSSIEWLCETDPKGAQKATEELAQFLRGNMDSLQSTQLIPVERELEHIRHYLTLEQIRFEEKLHVIYQITCDDFFLPPLSLQPLVENAVRHGVTKREEGGTIIVATEETAQSYVVSIRDDGVGFVPGEQPTDNRAHLGIENVQRRLAVQCGGSLTVESQPGRGTNVTVTIPKSHGL